LKAQHDTRSLAYWLSNLSTLSVLLQRSFKITRATTSTPLRRRFSCEGIFHANQTSNTGLSYFSSHSVDGAVGLHKIEARYPALLFKQQLVDMIQKVYGMINDKLKELNPLLELCIQVPPHLRKTNHAICKACLLKELEKSKSLGSKNLFLESIKGLATICYGLMPTGSTHALAEHR
jgi:hypothetical protein